MDIASTALQNLVPPVILFFLLGIVAGVLKSSLTIPEARAGNLADTLVLIATDEDRLRWGALGENDVCAVARGTGRVRVLIEPDPKRAVVGSMQWLRRDDTFCVVWSRAQSRSALEALIDLGAAWRGAWDEPKDGEFHAFPRGPDGFYTHDHQATDDGNKQGKDR